MTHQEHSKVGGMLSGGIMIRGLSGGEKRRLSTCCATITKPEILFADEPTSGKILGCGQENDRVDDVIDWVTSQCDPLFAFFLGLDSLAALMIISLLRDFTEDGMVILCTM